MNATISIKGITFSDGSTLSFASGEIVVFVGPNNSGKSAALREIHGGISTSPKPFPYRKVTRSVDVERKGSGDELINRLQQESIIYSPGASDPSFAGLGYNLQKSSALHWWTGEFATLRDVFSVLLNTETRLAACSPPEHIRLGKDPPTHPIHILQRDPTVEERVSGYFRAAFGTDLMIHRNAGKGVPLYCGNRPLFEGAEDRLSLSYIEKVEKLERLDQQGDGVKSFVGVVLHTLVAPRDIILIDEPDAFLHPPQARIMGRMLATELPSDGQTFCATHSGDFLRGLIDRDKGNIRVVRIRREGAINKVNFLENKDLKNVWSDPLLRYSNVLDAMFHRAAIVCESDSDCRFYGAMADAVYSSESDKTQLDLMFMHCGGKQRIPVAARALTSLEVPFAVVMDFDALREEEPLRSLFELRGGEWLKIECDYNIVRSSIDAKKPEIGTEEILKDIMQELAAVKDSIFPKASSEKIQKVLRRASPWALAKSVGKAYVPPGDASRAFANLISALEEHGVFIVPVGELESFDRSVAGHGPKWVNGVLAKSLTTDSELEEARKFVRRIVEFVMARSGGFR